MQLIEQTSFYLDLSLFSDCFRIVDDSFFYGSNKIMSLLKTGNQYIVIAFEEIFKSKIMYLLCFLHTKSLFILLLESFGLFDEVRD